MANRALLSEVAERRRVQDALRELNETLEQRVTQQSDTLVLTSVALDESGERYRALVDGSLDAITSLGSDGRFEAANPAALLLTGRTMEELRACSPVDLCAPDQREQTVAALASAFRNESVTMDTAIITASGERRDLFVSVTPALAEGRVVGLSCIARDVTDRRRAEHLLKLSEVRYRRLFETATDGILILDRQSGRVNDANPGMTDMLGYPHNEFIGRRMWEIGLVVDAAADEAILRELQQHGGARRTHLCFKARDGRQVDVEVVANAYEEGSHEAVQCNIRDITERRRLEKQLEAQTAGLWELHHRKDEFLAMLSHELRNPLAPIRHAAKISKDPRASPAQLQWCRDVIDRQVDHMARLLDDLLEVSRITRGKLELRKQHVVLRDSLDAAVETARPLIEARGHALSIVLPDEAIHLIADPVRLSQIFSNLLTNAAKYTEPGGRIRIRAVQRAGEVVITVRDNGIGLSAEQIPRLFEMFSQASTAVDRADGGLGIGLALGRALAELHGGTIEAGSAGLGRGSEFTVTLPAAPAQAAGETQPASVRDASRPSVRALRVLVADDNQDNADGCAMLLRLAGHEVRIAYSGADALVLAEQFAPQLALLDIGMPGMTGYDVARRIRESTWGAGIMLVAITGWGQLEDRVQCTAAGFDDHRIKPVDLAVLQAVVARCVEREGRA